MSVRFLNPHDVTHGSQGIANCRQARIQARFAEVKSLFGDAKAFPMRAAGFEPVAEIDLVTEDVVKALSIAPGTCATLSFHVADAQGGTDKTITGANAVYMGPVEEMGEAKSGAGTATMHFVCWSTTGGTNPISIA
jgi:hypothetical protein